jgi:hypothetical protein
MTTLSFHTTVPRDCTITLPAEFSGVPVKIVAKKPTKSPTMEQQSPIKGIVGLRGILKGYTLEELENARDEYLTEKYVHG